jgi:hypothetical protein
MSTAPLWKIIQLISVWHLTTTIFKNIYISTKCQIGCHDGIKWYVTLPWSDLTDLPSHSPCCWRRSESLGAPLNINVVEAVGLEGVYELDLTQPSINSVDEGLQSIRRHWVSPHTITSLHLRAQRPGYRYRQASRQASYLLTQYRWAWDINAWIYVGAHLVTQVISKQIHIYRQDYRFRSDQRH